MTAPNPEYASAIERLRSQTSLPIDRVREVFYTALRQAESTKSASDVPLIERAIMMATDRLWAEEKAKRGTRR